MTNNRIANLATADAWRDSFCERYPILMLEYGRWFLLAALIIGTAAAAAAVYISLRPPSPAPAQPQGGEAGGAAALQSVVDALKGLIEAFSKAPTWLAMFGGGILLLWMAGTVSPEFCPSPAAQRQQQQSPGAPKAAAQYPAGNQAGEANKAGQ